MAVPSRLKEKLCRLCRNVSMIQNLESIIELRKKLLSEIVKRYSRKDDGYYVRTQERNETERYLYHPKNSDFLTLDPIYECCWAVRSFRISSEELPRFEVFDPYMAAKDSVQVQLTQGEFEDKHDKGQYILRKLEPNILCYRETFRLIESLLYYGHTERAKDVFLKLYQHYVRSPNFLRDGSWPYADNMFLSHSDLWSTAFFVRLITLSSDLNMGDLRSMWPNMNKLYNASIVWLRRKNVKGLWEYHRGDSIHTTPVALIETWDTIRTCDDFKETLECVKEYVLWYLEHHLHFNRGRTFRNLLDSQDMYQVRIARLYLRYTCALGKFYTYGMLSSNEEEKFAEHRQVLFDSIIVYEDNLYILDHALYIELLSEFADHQFCCQDIMKYRNIATQKLQDVDEKIELHKENGQVQKNFTYKKKKLEDVCAKLERLLKQTRVSKSKLEEIKEELSNE